MQTDVQPRGESPRAATSSNDESPTVSSTAPGQLRVIKRNGAVVSYDEYKISVAITKAYLAVEGGNAAASTRIHESVAQLSSQISDIFRRRMPSGGTIHIEDIQDRPVRVYHHGDGTDRRPDFPAGDPVPARWGWRRR